jgi:hypothetical protein
MPANDNERDVDDFLHDTDVMFLAENTDISPLQAQELIRKRGRDREELLKLAKSMKAES